LISTEDFLTIRQAAVLGGIVGLLVSASVLILVWYGVSGILVIGNTDLMYIVWPSSLMLTVGWHSTGPGISITALSIGLNCLTYAVIAIVLRAGLARASSVWKPN